MDATAVLTAFLVALPLVLAQVVQIILALRTSRKTDELSKSVNGRLTQLVDVTEAWATAKGELQGRDDEQARTDRTPPAKPPPKKSP